MQAILPRQTRPRLYPLAGLLLKLQQPRSHHLLPQPLTRYICTPNLCLIRDHVHPFHGHKVASKPAVRAEPLAAIHGIDVLMFVCV